MNSSNNEALVAESTEWLDNISDPEALRAIIKEKQKKIESANKQLNEFVYIVSHDLKAPLRGLLSLSAFLEEELGQGMTAQTMELLTMMRSRSLRMQSLIDAILHYSRISTTKTEKQEVDLKNLIQKIIDQVAIPPTIKIEIADNLPVLFAEKVKVNEVFQCLLSNAVKFNKENGIVKIYFQELEKQFQFTVEDTGVGIKEEHVEKIFGIFQTLQSKDKSSDNGMGLTIVKKLVEDNDGKVWIESEPGKGTKVHFTWNKKS